MNNDKPSIWDHILFFVLLTLFVFCTVTLVKSGIVGVFSLIGSCK